MGASRTSSSWRNRARAISALAIGATLVPAAVACNTIIGLDAFDKVPGDAGAFDGNAIDTGVVDSGDSSTDGGIIIPPGASSATWARWMMPQDPALGISPVPTGSNALYADAGGGFLDEVTLLTWRPADNTTPATFTDAVAACANAAPINTWRLPTRIELVTLLDPRLSPQADARFELKNTFYWTSSVVHPTTTNPVSIWTVNFGNGAVAPEPSTGSPDVIAVICVKGT